MEPPRKVEVQLPPDERQWGCWHWVGAGCLVTLVLLGIGSYLVYKRYVAPVSGGVRQVLAEAEQVWELSDAEALSRADSTLTPDRLEANLNAYRGRFVKLRGIVESEETTRFTISDRRYRIFRVGEGTFVLATRFAEDVAYGDRVEIIGKVSEVDVTEVLEQVAPGLATGLTIDHAVIFLARRVRILPHRRRPA